MTDSPMRMDAPTRLDRAITWTGVGAATALAALFMMGGFWGFASSAPSADNVGEEGIATVIGVVCLVLSLVLSLPAGWTLARRSGEQRRPLLRALPVLISVAWVILAAALGSVGLRLVSGMWIGWIPLHQFALFSVFTAGALPICIGLLIAFFVLIVLRTRR